MICCISYYMIHIQAKILWKEAEITWLPAQQSNSIGFGLFFPRLVTKYPPPSVWKVFIVSKDIFRIYTRELDDRKKCWILKRERKITDGNIRNQDPFQWWQKQMQSYHKNMNNNCICQNKIEWINIISSKSLVEPGMAQPSSQDWFSSQISFIMLLGTIYGYIHYLVHVTSPWLKFLSPRTPVGWKYWLRDTVAYVIYKYIKV